VPSEQVFAFDDKSLSDPSASDAIHSADWDSSKEWATRGITSHQGSDPGASSPGARTDWVVAGRGTQYWAYFVDLFMAPRDTTTWWSNDRIAEIYQATGKQRVPVEVKVGRRIKTFQASSQIFCKIN